MMTRATVLQEVRQTWFLRSYFQQRTECSAAAVSERGRGIGAVGVSSMAATVPWRSPCRGPVAVGVIIGRVQIDRDALGSALEPLAVLCDDRRRHHPPHPIQSPWTDRMLEPGERGLRG
jgi:hypothetical protein